MIRLRCLRYFAAAVLGTAVLTGSVFSDTDVGVKDLKIFGMGSYEFGQIVRGQYGFSPTDAKLLRYWMQKGLLQIGVSKIQENGLGIILAGEGMLHFPFALPSDGSGAGYIYYLPRTTWYIHHAEAFYAKGDAESPFFKVGAGFFPYKYNLDGRNFGDYFFRSTIYPQYMPTDFDTPYRRLLGLRLESTLFASTFFDGLSEDLLSMKQQLLLTSEVYLWPLKDFSLTYLVDFNVLHFVEIGGGVMGYHMFPVDEELNRPSLGADNPCHFLFSGTKFMCKLAFDVKQIFPWKELWGKNDWRIYSEVCVNGLDNYPVADSSGGNTNEVAPGYNDIKKRLPVLIGFNFPTCKFLDVLSIEAEWWDIYPFANSYTWVYIKGYAQPPKPTKYELSGHKDPYGGPWHWSIYAKKTVLKNIKLIAQAARDHTVIETSQTGMSTGDPQEAMDGRGNWAWMCKIEYGF